MASSDGGVPAAPADCAVFRAVVSKPALVAWAACCDLDRRARVQSTVDESRTSTAALVTGRPLEAGATWKVTTLYHYTDDANQSQTAEEVYTYTLASCVPGQSIVFSYEGPSARRVPLRLAIYFTSLPDGRTEITEHHSSPLYAVKRSASFIITTIVSCGILWCAVNSNEAGVRRRQRAAFEKVVALVESLDVPTWSAGVAADLAALKSGNHVPLPFLLSQSKQAVPAGVPVPTAGMMMT